MSPDKCRKIVKARSRDECERCASPAKLSLHHRKKRSQGGAWTPSNCVMLCGSGTTGCHGWVESNPNDAESEGWHVRPWDDPLTVPIFLHGAGHCYLNDEGGHEWR